jgi:hypothetical protein
MSAFDPKRTFSDAAIAPKGNLQWQSPGSQFQTNFPSGVVTWFAAREDGQMKEHQMKPCLKHLKSTACAVGIVLSMLVGSLQAQQVPIPQTAAEVSGPAPGPMTKAYVQMMGRMAYFLGVASRLCL